MAPSGDAHDLAQSGMGSDSGVCGPKPEGWVQADHTGPQGAAAPSGAHCYRQGGVQRLLQYIPGGSCYASVMHFLLPLPFAPLPPFPPSFPLSPPHPLSPLSPNSQELNWLSEQVPLELQDILATKLLLSTPTSCTPLDSLDCKEQWPLIAHIPTGQQQTEVPACAFSKSSHGSVMQSRGMPCISFLCNPLHTFCPCCRGRPSLPDLAAGKAIHLPFLLIGSVSCSRLALQLPFVLCSLSLMPTQHAPSLLPLSPFRHSPLRCQSPCPLTLGCRAMPQGR